LLGRSRKSVTKLPRLHCNTTISRDVTPALFVDRDGVDFKWNLRIMSAVCLSNIVTNQETDSRST
ncbi:MAG: hypothetical protein ABI298_08285, partial [Acidimicrobiales bacterium]